MQDRRFIQVDVFGAGPYRGNALAVVQDGQGLDAETMQQFTDWTQLSEATFLLPPSAQGAAAGADYRVRIFCPGRELPFAGHPTLGSCHAWLAAGGVPRRPGVVVQECGVGLVPVRLQVTDARSSSGPAAPQRLAFAAPPRLRSGPLDEAELALIARGLRVGREAIVQHAWCDNGPKWRGVMLASAQQVLALQPDFQALAGLDLGVVAPQAPGSDTAFEVRAFFSAGSGVLEDPVTGSLNAALAQWLIAAGLAPDRYVAAQGTVLGRAGRVHVQREEGQIWIGGDCVTCINGAVRL